MIISSSWRFYINKKIRINHFIKAPEVRLIDADGVQVGVINIRDAITNAKNAGLDLVEVAPDAKPPVCKVMDFGKYKYQMEKKHTHKKPVEIKTVKLRPHISSHDLERKINQMLEFLDSGDKARITMFFRGREIIRPEMGMVVFDKIIEKLNGNYTIEMSPKLERKSITMVVGPK